MNSWGERRKLVIEIVLGAFAVAFLAIVFIATFYQAPSCMDKKQDGNETGVDCGGSCSTLCAASVAQPVVRFVRAVNPEPGRTDVIAYIDNPNAVGGVMHAKYTLELHGPDGSLVTTRTGTVNLPPSMTAPLYVAHAYDGSKSVSQAFLTLDPASLVWEKGYQKPVTAVPGDIQIIDGQQPKVTAKLTNPTAQVLYEVGAVVTVFDPSGNAIAASQTLVPSVPAQGSTPIVFTWNTPFPDTPARVEILPATGS